MTDFVVSYADNVKIAEVPPRPAAVFGLPDAPTGASCCDVDVRVGSEQAASEESDRTAERRAAERGRWEIRVCASRCVAMR